MKYLWNNNNDKTLLAELITGILFSATIFQGLPKCISIAIGTNTYTLCMILINVTYLSCILFVLEYDTFLVSYINETTFDNMQCNHDMR